MAILFSCRPTCMGWLRLVGSLKFEVSFAEYSLFHRALLPKRPIMYMGPGLEKREFWQLHALLRARLHLPMMATAGTYICARDGERRKVRVRKMCERARDRRRASVCG